MEALPQDQRDPGALSKLYVSTGAGGRLIPLDSVAKLTRTAGPLSVNHTGQLPSVTVSFNLKPGVSLSEAVEGIDKTLRELRLPITITGFFQGSAQAFQNSLQSLWVLLIIAMLVIYMVLGILYESFIHPLTILSGLPSAGFGALLTLLIFHVDLSLYAFVGTDHADRHREEERDHDDRFRARRAAQRGQEPARSHLPGLPGALPADHDDDDGGAASERCRSRSASARARKRGGRWAWRWWAGCCSRNC